ncbi:MAG: argininosuccinate synthase [Calditrichia bacterium]|nr:argininosuccinate synthase [Calditrichia bacterium]
MKKKVLLAFSGGLDTSYCARYLSTVKNLEVHSIIIDSGGFSGEELSDIKKRAQGLGVTKHYSIDVTRDYYKNCIRFLIYGNVLRNNTYPLSVSAERIFQAKAVARQAKKIGADYVAHGSTGAGNDQIRFDMIFNILIPQIEVLTPIRDQQLSREEEINFLREQGIQMDWEKMQYSINKGLWGTSVGGKETLTSDTPLPDDAYPTPVSKIEPAELEIEFQAGQVSGINGKKFEDPVEAIKSLNELAAPYGIGRDIHVGDTIIGIKGRVGFEAAAAILLIKAHHALEKHTLTKWQIYWKDQISVWYGMHLHEGQYLDPVMRNIENFLENTQITVNGTVFLKLFERRFEIQGINSSNDLMSDKFGAYGEMNLAWDGNDARGFAKIAANQSWIYRTINQE